jgi:hypothetical protein
MSLRFLGTDTQDGQSPTLWETSDGWLVIQGYTSAQPAEHRRWRRCALPASYFGRWNRASQ